MDSLLQDYVLPTSKISEITCEICGENPSKYRCPRCELASCCLACTKRHKEIRHCSGKRNSAAFVARSDFSDSTLSSDIGFLEETARCAMLARSHLRSVDPMVHKGVLVDEANRRMVDLRLLAEWFPKRKENRTCFRGRNMFWTVKWIVNLVEDEEPLEILSHNTKEYRQVSEVFYSLLTDRTVDKKLKERLISCLGDKKPDDLSFVLQLDPAHRHRCALSFNLPPTMKLHACLARKIIVEYPTILVRLKPLAPLIDGEAVDAVEEPPAFVVKNEV